MELEGNEGRVEALERKQHPQQNEAEGRGLWGPARTINSG